MAVSESGAFVSEKLIEDGTMYSDRYVALITETIQGMIKRN